MPRNIGFDRRSLALVAVVSLTAITAFAGQTSTKDLLIGTRSSMQAAVVKSDGYDWANSMTRHRLPNGARSIRVRYSNIITSTSGGVGEKSNTISAKLIYVRSAIWLPFGHYTAASSVNGGTLNVDGVEKDELVGLTLVSEASHQTASIVSNDRSQGGTTVFHADWKGAAPPSGSDLKLYRVQPLRWNGDNEPALAPNVIADSDPVTVDVPEDGEIYVRTSVRVGRGGYWPGADFCSRCVEKGEWAQAGTGPYEDLSTSGYPEAPSGRFSAIVPSCILGIPKSDRKPAVLADGDSRVYGSGDVTPNGINGVLARVLDRLDVPYFNGGVPGETSTSGLLGSGRNSMRTAIAANVKYAWVSVGINDTLKRVPLVSTKSSLLRKIAWYRAKGIKVVVSIPMPSNYSNDGWTSVEAQTPGPYEKARASLAAWMRDPSKTGMQAMSGDGVWFLWDASPYQETAQDSGIVKPARPLYTALKVTEVGTTSGDCYVEVDRGLSTLPLVTGEGVELPQMVLPAEGSARFATAFGTHLDRFYRPVGGTYLNSNVNRIVASPDRPTRSRIYVGDWARGASPKIGSSFSLYESLWTDGLHYGRAGSRREADAFPSNVFLP